MASTVALSVEILTFPWNSVFSIPGQGGSGARYRRINSRMCSPDILKRGLQNIFYVYKKSQNFELSVSGQLAKFALFRNSAGQFARGERSRCVHNFLLNSRTLMVQMSSFAGTLCKFNAVVISHVVLVSVTWRENWRQ